jgi:hypothetical protein
MIFLFGEIHARTGGVVNACAAHQRGPGFKPIVAIAPLSS